MITVPEEQFLVGRYVIVALDDLVLELEEGVDLAMEQTKVVIVNVLEGLSQCRELRDLFIKVLLVHEGVEKAGCVRFA